MKAKHIKIRAAQCDLIASASPCSRRKVGALIIEPTSNSIISEGYNGTPRGSDKFLCGGSTCHRTTNAIKSGTQNDVGCHHAEINAILNAARIGVSTQDSWLFTNCDPCLMCAKSIHHAGISKVYTKLTSQSAGIVYLQENKIKTVSTSEL